MVSAVVFMALCGPCAALWCPKTRLFVQSTEGRLQHLSPRGRGQEGVDPVG